MSRESPLAHAEAVSPSGPNTRGAKRTRRELKLRVNCFRGELLLGGLGCSISKARNLRALRALFGIHISTRFRPILTSV